MLEPVGGLIWSNAMKRRTLRLYLGQTDDDIDRATDRLERQSRIAIRMKESGRDVRVAEELLTLFERSPQNLRTERELILRVLDREGP